MAVKAITTTCIQRRNEYQESNACGTSIEKRGQRWKMPSAYLHGIKMKRESKSYVDSVHAILTAAGLFNGPKYRLAGLSGMAFKFAVHRRLLPLSVSAYGQWIAEHSPAIDNLGLFTMTEAGRIRLPMFRKTQQDAVTWIKSSLDRGMGAVYWIPEFGVIHGYDDDDLVFYVQDGYSKSDLVVLYDNIGLNFTPFWYCEVFGDAVRIAPQAMIVESLRLAIYDWDTPHKTLPDTDIASGRLAYRYLIDGLVNADYDEDGAVYILSSYAHSRREIMSYLAEAKEELAGLDEPYALFADLVRVIDGFEGCWCNEEGLKRVDRNRVTVIVERLTKAVALEQRAVDRFRSISAQYPDLKRSLVPRWGISTPR